MEQAQKVAQIHGGEDVSFTITCNSCGNSVEITSENVREFVNEYGWADYNFQLTEETPIGAFVTYDTPNETVMCKCGNKVTR